MPDAITPDTGPAPVDTSFDKGVEDIAALLDLPETEQEETEAQAEGTEPDATADEAADEDEPLRNAKGQFVSADGKWRLDDGTVISVGELARNNLYQRDYTRKTQATAEKAKALDERERQLSEHAAQMAAEREFLLAASQRRLPKAPDRDMALTDPVGYMHAKAVYDEEVTDLNRLWHQKQSDDARKSQETESQKANRQRDEAEKLLDPSKSPYAIPEYQNRAAYNALLADIGPVMAETYGYSTEDLAPLLDDHRAYRVFRDLVFLAKARANKGKVQQTLKDKPALPVMQGGKRVDPNARNSREAQQRTAKLRQSGSLDDFVAAVADKL